LIDVSRVAVILPAAGASTRFGGQVKKIFRPLAGQAVWERSLALFVDREDVVQVLLVVAASDRPTFEHALRRQAGRAPVALVEGGSERFESVANALAQVDAAADLVAIHDAARPLVPPERIDAVLAVARQTGAAMLAIPVADTLKQADAAGRVVATVPRAGLWLAQTPQVFRVDWLRAAQAHRTRLGTAITDDAQLLEAAGHAVQLVPGCPTNLKITTPDDLRLAEAILRQRL
jgi:2-C-methyl-D-erythritol 4-phosphate cytidylyltransferase